MGREKVVTYCNDRYKGSLTEESCEILEQLIELDKANGCVSDLRHIIYNLNDSDVTDMIECMEQGGTMLPIIDKKHGTLRDEQTVGVALLYYAGNCILGDSVGLGKTVETAGLANLLKTEYSKRNEHFNYLLLTEKSLAEQVRREMVKFTGEYVELLPSSEAKVVDKYVINHYVGCELDYSLVGTHGLLTANRFINWLEMCRTGGVGFPFDLLVIDESSILGNSTTDITKSFNAISKYFKRIIFLNATPFETRLDIFYTQLNLLDKQLLPTKENFNKEYIIYNYTGMYKKPTGKYRNQAQFKRMVGYRYFARTRRDKGAIMEDCHGGILLSPLSPIQKVWLERTQLNRLVYDCPTYLDRSIEFCTENVPKLASLQNLLSDECADADSILIFSHYKEPQFLLSKWLTERGHSNKILNGDITNVKERQRIIDGFKNKEYKILITSVQKGLNFGDCNYCIFYSFDPNPSAMIQFEGRTTRSFDIIGKNVYVLCSIGKEYQRLNKVVRERARATEQMSNTDISVIMDILLGESR